MRVFSTCIEPRAWICAGGGGGVSRQGVKKKKKNHSFAFCFRGRIESHADISMWDTNCFESAAWYRCGGVVTRTLVIGCTAVRR